MNKLMKLFIASLLLAGSVWQYAGAFGSNYDTSYQITEVTASSATVGTPGRMWVKSVYYSTGTTLLTDWWMLMDTAPIASNTYTNFASAVKRTPAILFQAPQTSTGQPTGDGYYRFDFQDDVYFSTACFVYKTNASSGEALKVFVKWRN